MNATATQAKTSVKVIGVNGQISLGKYYAGRQVLIEEQEPGVWFIRTAIVIPENERWLHEPQAAASLKAALAWSQNNSPKETDLATLFDRFTHDQKPNKTVRTVRSQQPRVSKKLASA